MVDQAGNNGPTSGSAFSFALAGIHLTINGSEALIREVIELLRTEILPTVGKEGIRAAAAELTEKERVNGAGAAAEKGGGGEQNEGDSTTPKQFADQKQPRYEHEKAAVFAYYLKVYRNKNEFGVGDLEKLHNEAHVQFKSVQNAIYNAGKKGKGWIKSVAGQTHVYYLTAAGESYVKTQLPKKKS